MIKTAILTISDSCSNGTREDLSGQTIIDMLPKNEFQVIQKKIIPDDLKKITNELTHFADNEAIDIVFTTGGTGLGPRDVTPEATVSVSDKIVPGFGEIMRTEGFKKTHSAILSRGTACIRKNTLIINLPGSPKAVHESLEIMLDVLSHALEMIHGGGHE
jgi:molybdopterin adenylyltransferase